MVAQLYVVCVGVVFVPLDIYMLISRSRKITPQSFFYYNFFLIYIHDALHISRDDLSLRVTPPRYSAGITTLFVSSTLYRVIFSSSFSTFELLKLKAQTSVSFNFSANIYSAFWREC